MASSRAQLATSSVHELSLENACASPCCSPHLSAAERCRSSDPGADCVICVVALAMFSTRAAQGDCDFTTTLPGVNPRDPLPPLRPRQCHILVAGQFLEWGGNAPNVWLHNVYVRLKRRTQDSNVHFLDWRPADVRARLWVTSSTFEGDARPPTPGGFTVAEPASAIWAIRAHTSPIYVRGANRVWPVNVSGMPYGGCSSVRVTPATSACALSCMCARGCYASTAVMACFVVRPHVLQGGC